MRFTVMADTDIGRKKTNQDSLVVKHGESPMGEIVMAVICDGMGGLDSGEVVSATVVKTFSKWFDEELPYELKHLDMKVIGEKWSFIIKDLNDQIGQYGRAYQLTLGTTFTGILFAGKEYVAVHVGDTRIYEMTDNMRQLTTDQTFIHREISMGRMTLEQAKCDKRRNMLLQCVGASKVIEPEVIYGSICQGVYMLCSDGFRHEVSGKEIYQLLNPAVLSDKEVMYRNIRELIERVKARNEQDNISAILIKVNEE